MNDTKVLVVEDDPAIGANLQRALANAGHLCELADTAAAARGIVTAPDLVLLDLGLPDADGLDLIREHGAPSSSPAWSRSAERSFAGPDRAGIL